MAGGGGAAVGDLALDEDVGVVMLETAANGRDEFGDGEDAAGRWCRCGSSGCGEEEVELWSGTCCARLRGGYALQPEVGEAGCIGAVVARHEGSVPFSVGSSQLSGKADSFVPQSGTAE